VNLYPVFQIQLGKIIGSGFVKPIPDIDPAGQNNTDPDP
jgi:hypothetical protein